MTHETSDSENWDELEDATSDGWSVDLSYGYAEFGTNFYRLTYLQDPETFTRNKRKRRHRLNLNREWVIM